MLTAGDWEARYQSGEMPWEKGAPSPGLEEYLERTGLRGPGTVLVPGCGTGHDVRSWARRGFQVVGLDLAPSALKLARERTAEAGLEAEFREVDFLRSEPWMAFDWIFEHTLFCAIHPTERDLYVTAVSRWLKPGGSFLAVHYMLEDKEGPPFGCTQAELMRRFEPHLALEAGWVPASYPNRTGLELMLRWERRAGS